MRRLAALLALLLMTGVSARAEAPPAPDLAARFASANEMFDRGAREAAEKPAAAREAMQPAIAAYSAMIDGEGLQSAALHFNLGNAYLLSGENGRAVLHYKRAQRLDPSLPGIAKNLAAARAKIGLRGAAVQAPVGEKLLAWHTAIPQRARLWLAAGGLAIAGTLLLLRAMPRLSRSMAGMPRPPALTVMGFAGVASLAGLSLIQQERRETTNPPAVVIADRVIGRKGPDEVGYQPSFTEPLRAGTEITVREVRGSWLNVRLPDGRDTWVPAASVDRV